MELRAVVAAAIQADLATLGRTGVRAALVALLLAATFTAPRPADAAVSMGAWMQHSPDDISGFTSMSGNNTATVTLPFTFTVEGTNYTQLVLSTHGWIEFGSNTSGGTDSTNDCLPTSAHTNPFVAAYWDDLNPFGTAVRYGTVGTSPNRTWIADFEVDLTSGVEGQDDLRFQIQLHERSNLINVRFRDTQNNANGQGATMGYQGAGGGSATTVQPISCNGKVLDDNRPNEGWSADVGRAGQVVLSALIAHSPDDIGGFATLSGDNAIAGVTMPFSVTIEGTSYNTLTIGTNGTIQFGTTTGSNPSGNTALPSSSFPNPTIFYYWDDLQTEGGNIRYGTVGGANNRVFIVDFQENLVASSGDKVNGQVQIHERSGLINVKYRSTLSANANGQSATIGFQGAGGASAATYPLTFNGKILDDNRPDSGWSVHPQTLGAMSLHANVEYSPDDISGFATLSGDNAIAGVTMPFSITIDGTSYNTITIGTNGLVQFGTTTGANPTGNVALPSSSFPNPTLFWNWDDLQTEGNNIRHASVGSSPHRTYIIDFQQNRVGSTGDKVNGQVQIHEGSNVINVFYRSTLSPNSNGQNATIGFQGAGGASAEAYPLTFNGKILDDNLPEAGFSVAPLPVCGNSIIETKESCDLGGSNGSSTSCCTSTCGFRSSGAVCRAAADVCDAADTCTGSSSACPADGKVASGTSCRASVGSCDIAEVCNGSSNACPSDAAAPSGTLCRASAGACDPQEVCTGSTICPADTLQPSGTVCRASLGICDVTEVCDGVAGDCPADTVAPSGTACRAAADVCDAAEVCTGSAPLCPGDGKQASGTPCRASIGVCDLAEVCDGSADSCPSDAAAPSGTLCRASTGSCDPQEVCTGSTTCPADTLEPSGTVCRAAASVCDVTESCDGVAGDCPSDTVAASGTSCRAAVDFCDAAEVCDGSAPLCPSDGKQPSGTACRASADTCDLAEVCDGSTDACPSDAFAATSVVCRAATDVCDAAENCTGSGSACPSDAKQPSGTSCRAAAGVCDVGEVCDGSADACPADAKVGSGTTCRAAAGSCDVDEACDGATDDCAADAVQPSGFVCDAGSGDLCDPDEVCDGSSPACPVDTVTSSGTVCRPGSGDVCDPDETCTGNADAACPPDVVSPTSTVCRGGSGDVCDPDEFCPGVPTGTCAADVVAPPTTVCRSGSGDVCDPDETCPGVAAGTCAADVVAPPSTVCNPGSGDLCDPDETCPGVPAGTCAADVVAPASTPCRAGADVCDVTDFCPGTPDATCTADAKQTSGTVCRAAAGSCDAVEVCDGSTNACAADADLPDGSSCEDGQYCNGAETCSAGTCTDQNDPCTLAAICNESTDSCQTNACPPTPQSCQTALKSKLIVKNNGTDSKDKLIWKFIKGTTSTTQPDFADPESSAFYALCIYENATLSPNLVGTIIVPPNAGRWSPISTKGYKYLDATLAEDGTQKIIVKSSTTGKTKALLKGKGTELPEVLDGGMLTLPVTAQLYNYGSGLCWQGTYATAKKNTTSLFKANE